MTNNNPSIDPADNDSLPGVLQFFMKKAMQNINHMLPAKIIKYDRATNRAQVQLLITMVTTDGEQVPRSQIASIPVLSIGGGGFLINFPLNPGDLGWVVANDRDISLFLQSYAQSRPNTARVMNFSDGLFIPDAMHGYTIAGEDTANMVIQNLAGTVRIAIGAAGVKIISPLTTIEGNLAVIGNITATGTITP